MEKIPVSVGILTFNSGKTLRRALESVQDVEDIIICDGGSSDDTLAIAQEYGARVIHQDLAFQKEGGGLKDYAGVRNQCLDAARHDWFFYIDSDERATPELLEEIRGIVTTNSPVLIYNISPRIVLDGKVIEHSSNYPGWQKRFFNRRSGARFRKAIHERIEYDATRYSEGFLKGHWNYFISVQEDPEKTEKYARMDARQYETQSLGRLSHLLVRKIFTIAKIAVKAMYNACRYPRTSMPLALEARRIRYQWHLLVYLTLAFFGRTI